jgi:hypothetical protein
MIKSTTTSHQFRLNGTIITHVKVRPVLNERASRGWELVACDERLGDFAVDDNGGLADPALTQFILEIRDANIPPIERRYMPNKGWKRVTTREYLALLELSGVALEQQFRLREELKTAPVHMISCSIPFAHSSRSSAS